MKTERKATFMSTADRKSNTLQFDSLIERRLKTICWCGICCLFHGWIGCLESEQLKIKMSFLISFPRGMMGPSPWSLALFTDKHLFMQLSFPRSQLFGFFINKIFLSGFELSV